MWIASFVRFGEINYDFSLCLSFICSWIFAQFSLHNFLNVYNESHPSHIHAVQSLWTNSSSSGSFISWVGMSHTWLMKTQHVTPSLNTKPHQVSFTKSHTGMHIRCVVSFLTIDAAFSTSFLPKIIVNVLRVIFLSSNTHRSFKCEKTSIHC
jgi:hypothetical protein